MCRRGSQLSGSNAACWGCGGAGHSLRLPVATVEPEIKYLLLLCSVHVTNFMINFVKRHSELNVKEIFFFFFT